LKPVCGETERNWAKLREMWRNWEKLSKT